MYVVSLKLSWVQLRTLTIWPCGKRGVGVEGGAVIQWLQLFIYLSIYVSLYTSYLCVSLHIHCFLCRELTQVKREQFIFSVLRNHSLSLQLV